MLKCGSTVFIMDKLKDRKKSFSLVLIDGILLGIIILIFAPYAISLLFRITPFFIVSGSMTHKLSKSKLLDI